MQLCQGEAVNSNAFYGRPFREPRRGGHSDLLWQSGASESATVCFVISLSICYWLFKCGVLRIVCVCVWERGGDTVTQQRLVCLCERESERETESHHSGVYSTSEIVLIAACLQTHRSFITVSVTRLCSPLGLELMVKLRTLLTVFILKAKARDYECNHNALCQLANQSRLSLSEGGTL